MKVATWNVQWAAPGSDRGSRVIGLLTALECEILAVTEGSSGLLPQTGHVIDAGDDWGYGRATTRRKVLAWSMQAWHDVVRFDRGAGSGRVVIGTTDTSIGPVRVAAVCIPWRDCHVRTGRRDAEAWSEHIQCCEQIGDLLQAHRDGLPLITLGDFNQRIPRHRSPEIAAEALATALAGQVVWTIGTTPHGRLIDHIASSPSLSGSRVETWPGRNGEGPLSDHSGVALALSVRPPDASPGTG